MPRVVAILLGSILILIWHINDLFLAIWAGFIGRMIDGIKFCSPFLVALF